MSWFTENPWPLLLILGGAAVVAMISGAPKGRSVSIVCLLAAVGLYFVESNVVTPAEEVESQLQTMLKRFEVEIRLRLIAVSQMNRLDCVKPQRRDWKRSR